MLFLVTGFFPSKHRRYNGKRRYTSLEPFLRVTEFENVDRIKVRLVNDLDPSLHQNKTEKNKNFRNVTEKNEYFFSRSLLYEHREVFDMHVAVYFNEVKALMIVCFINEIPFFAYNIYKDTSMYK